MNSGSLKYVFLAIVHMITIQRTLSKLSRHNLDVSSQERVIYVNKNGKNCQECLQDTNQGSQSCRTLEYVADQIGRETENVKIIIKTSIKVSGPVEFQECNNISIQGDFSIITCNCSQKSLVSRGPAGFTFVDVQHLHISKVSFVNCCGSLNGNLNASLALKRSSDVTIESVVIRQNTLNSGLMLIDCHGALTIHNSTLSMNNYKVQPSQPFSTSFAAGLHMEFSGIVNLHANVSITNTTFERNHSPKYRKLDPEAVMRQANLNGYSLGGGLGIIFIHKNTGSIVNIQNCAFKKNKGMNSGGLCVHFQDKASDNVVRVTNTIFTGNEAVVGGGGVMVSFSQNPISCTRNSIQFSNITSENNFAIFGGGLSIAALFSYCKSDPGELIRFMNCTWRGNTALYSPAVDISPFRFQQARQIEGFLPIPLFSNCHILDNLIVTDRQPRGRSKFHITQGVFIITRFSVHFQGSHEFQNNSYSALYLTSGRAIFKADSEVLFKGNVGINGGAISAHGFSTIVVNDNSQFHFVNNSAITVGGAVYYASNDQREYFEGRSCFLEYEGNESDLNKRNTSFIFSDNRATRGLSIYTASLFTCYYAYVGRFNNNLAELLDHIGHFQFDQSTTIPTLSTGIRYVDFEGSPLLSAIPGKKLYLPLGMKDEFKSSIKSGYGLRVKGNEDMYLSNYFTINNTTKVFGSPNQSAQILLSTPQELYNLQYNVKVYLMPCPPGYFFNEVSSGCKCSADVPEHSYPAITKCNHANFRAFVQYGFWVGYHPADRKDSNHLFTALFPFSHSSYGTALLLPNTSDNLPEYVCMKNRKGLLCGECKQNFSTFYHSKDFICGENTGCKFGILFYFLSDIVSLTILFTIVITFGVSFSSGSLNGLVFFSQVLDTFSLEQTFSNSHSGNNNNIIAILHYGYQLVYGVFNLDFFPIFPFCLWKGATIMDLLVIKYVTTLFAFILILLIVGVTNYSSKRLKGLCRLKRWAEKTVAPNSSIIHGISTLLNISYSQCTKASFSILAMVYLQSKPGIKSIPVTYYGGLPYLEGRHLLYAIPAIIVCLTIVTLPLLCLLLYPSLLHILALCKLSEHTLINRLSVYTGISRLMPLFDSFQGCYKDKLRFFSGLYFLYRVAILLAFTYSELTYYVITLFLVLMMLGIHSIAQPYKHRKHNIIDGLIFLNLAIINGITVILKLSLTTEFAHGIKNNTNFISLIQVIFAYLPIIVLFFASLKHLVVKITSISKHRLRSDGLRSFIKEERRSIVCNDISHTSVELTEPFLQLGN